MTRGNPYTIRTDALRTDAFHEMPEHLMRFLRKHTAASFVVQWHTNYYQGWIGDTNFGDVPVIIRYEFKLQRRRESFPEIIARITRVLDPAFKQMELYRNLPANLQFELENRHAKREYVTQSFSALRVKRYPAFENSGNVCYRFYFVRIHADGTESFEISKAWCSCSPAIVEEVRKKLESEFRMQLEFQFVVLWETTCYDAKFGDVPVIVRYEFTLKRHQHSGPEIMARITRYLDTAFKKTEVYKNASEVRQFELENVSAKRENVIKSFSALRVKYYPALEKLGENCYRFCFVRTHADGTNALEWSDYWTACSSTIVEEVRSELKIMFDMELDVEK